MNEEYLRQLRDAAVLQLAKAISLDPAAARVSPEQIERITVDGHSQDRIRLDVAVDLALAMLKEHQSTIDRALGARRMPIT